MQDNTSMFVTTHPNGLCVICRNTLVFVEPDLHLLFEFHRGLMQTVDGFEESENKMNGTRKSCGRLDKDVHIIQNTV
jgi:hypothetical protein